MKFIFFVLFLLTSCSKEEKFAPAKNDKHLKYQHLILEDKPTLEYIKTLQGQTIDFVEISDLSPHNSLRLLVDKISVKKGNYSNLIFLTTTDHHKIDLKKSSTNLPACLDAICSQSGLKWSIYFYNGSLNHPMIVLGTEQNIMYYQKSKK